MNCGRCVSYFRKARCILWYFCGVYTKKEGKMSEVIIGWFHRVGFVTQIGFEKNSRTQLNGSDIFSLCMRLSLTSRNFANCTIAQILTGFSPVSKGVPYYIFCERMNKFLVLVKSKGCIKLSGNIKGTLSYEIPIQVS